MKNSKDRGRQVATVLTRMSEKQRIEVAKNFVGDNGETLKVAIDDKFSGDVKMSLSELIRSAATFSIYFIPISFLK